MSTTETSVLGDLLATVSSDGGTVLRLPTSATPTSLRFYGFSTPSSDYVGLKAPTTAIGGSGSYDLTLPGDTLPAAGRVSLLQVDENGALAYRLNLPATNPTTSTFSNAVFVNSSGEVQFQPVNYASSFVSKAATQTGGDLDGPIELFQFTTSDNDTSIIEVAIQVTTRDDGGVYKSLSRYLIIGLINSGGSYAGSAISLRTVTRFRSTGPNLVDGISSYEITADGKLRIVNADITNLATGTNNLHSVSACVSCHSSATDQTVTVALL